MGRSCLAFFRWGDLDVPSSPIRASPSVVTSQPILGSKVVMRVHSSPLLTLPARYLTHPPSPSNLPPMWWVCWWGGFPLLHTLLTARSLLRVHLPLSLAAAACSALPTALPYSLGSVRLELSFDLRVCVLSSFPLLSSPSLRSSFRFVSCAVFLPTLCVQSFYLLPYSYLL